MLRDNKTTIKPERSNSAIINHMTSIITQSMNNRFWEQRVLYELWNRLVMITMKYSNVDESKKGVKDPFLMMLGGETSGANGKDQIVQPGYSSIRVASIGVEK